MQSESNNSTFKDQFSLIKGGDKTNNFIQNKYSYLDEPTTYNKEEITANSMHPYNYMDRFKDRKMENFSKNRRDNTLIIKDYHSQEVGQYAKPKKEINNLFEPVVNLNALAGDTKIVDKIGLNRYSDALPYKNNDFPENTNIRPEYIDGTPITEVIRPREKTLEELRGSGIHSIRLDPNGRTNETAGPVIGGVGTNPNSIEITKFKMKSYRDQTSVDDLLRTTGAITRPEWRSMVKETSSERSYFEAVDGPPVAAVMRTEYRNEQSARPTLKDETIVNTYLSNAVSIVPQVEYRNEQSARPTIKEETVVNNYLSNPFGYVGKEEFRNEQLARPTIRTDYEDNTNIINPVSFVPSQTYRNEQLANPTIRTDYEDNTNIINPVSFVPGQTYRNEQLANPTIRTDYEYNTNIINPVSFVPGQTYHNEQLANPTIRTDYEYNTNIINPVSFVPGQTYRNEQSANPTNRTDYENYMYFGHGNNDTAGYVYENNQTARPTIRNDTENNKFMGPSFNENMGQVYENNQTANPTNRDENNEFMGPGFNQTNSQYKKYGDITRSGVVEEVLAKDYMGAQGAFVSRYESREQATNMIQNQSVEDSINLTKRDLMGGGTDRIPQGRDNIGEYNDNNWREAPLPTLNRVRNVAVSYITEVPETRGYNILQERSNINQYVAETISRNPFVNNIVYTGTGNNDIIRDNTLISDRNINRESI
jgi:hypothetical protein